MNRDKWNSFLDDLLEKHPEAQRAVFAARKAMEEKDHELYKGQSVYTAFGHPPRAEEIGNIERSKKLRELEKDFYNEYKSQELDAPSENPFDSVREHYYETDFERGDAQMNEYSERFEKAKAEARVNREREKSGVKNTSYEFDDLLKEEEKRAPEQEKGTDAASPKKREYGEPSRRAQFMETYRENNKDMSKKRDRDKDKD